MLDIGKLMEGASSLFTPTRWSLRAQVQGARIQDKPTDVEFIREGVALPVQTVRIEFHDTTPSDSVGVSGVSFARKGTLFGVRGHPEIGDLDIDEWDTFVMDEKEYTITSVNRHLIGQIQAEFEAIG